MGIKDVKKNKDINKQNEKSINKNKSILRPAPTKGLPTDRSYTTLLFNTPLSYKKGRPLGYHYSIHGACPWSGTPENGHQSTEVRTPKVAITK